MNFFVAKKVPIANRYQQGDILISTEDITVSANFTNTLKKNKNIILLEGDVLNFIDIPKNSNVNIYTLSGRIVESFKLISNRVSVNLPNGFLIVSARTNKSVYSQKIVLHR